MDFFVSQTLNGLTLGTLLFLTASGLSVVIGLMRILNLSHGATFLFGGFVGMSVQVATGNFFFAVIAGIVGAAALGWVVQRLFLTQLMGSSFRQVLLTLGIAFVVSDCILWIWGGIPRLRSSRHRSLSGSVQIAGTTYPTYRLFLIALGIAAGVTLWIVWERSLLGAKLRACVDDRAIAATQGINVGAVFSAVFVIGAALAGMAGVLGGVVLGVSIGLDFQMQLLALVVVIIGGLGSLNGAFVGSMLVGLLDSFSKASFPTLAYFTIFAPVVIILIPATAGLVRQRRRLGMKERLKAARFKLIIIAAIAAAAAVAGIALDAYWIGVLSQALMMGLAAVALDVLVGWSGMPSLGHAAFFGVAGYTLAIMTTRWDINPWLAAVAGVVLALLLASGFAPLAVRTHGLAFLTVTLAFGQVIWGVATKWYGVTGGSDGIAGVPRPEPLFGFSLYDPRSSTCSPSSSWRSSRPSCFLGSCAAHSGFSCGA